MLLLYVSPDCFTISSPVDQSSHLSADTSCVAKLETLCKQFEFLLEVPEIFFSILIPTSWLRAKA